MKLVFGICLMVLLPALAVAQQNIPDSLRRLLLTAPNDSVTFEVERKIYTYFEEINRDSALRYAQMRHDIATKNRRKIEEAYTLGQIAYQEIYLGRYSDALNNITQAMKIAGDKHNDQENTWDLTVYATAGKSRLLTLGMLNHMMGHLMLQTSNPASVKYFLEGRRIGFDIGNDFRVTVADMVLASTYLSFNKPDSALFFAKEGEVYGTKGGIPKYLVYIWLCMGNIYFEKGDTALALSYYHKSLHDGISQDNFTVAEAAYDRLINYYRFKNNADSVLYYAKENLALTITLGAVTSFAAGEVNIGTAYQNLADGYNRQANVDSANKYMQLALIASDSLADIKFKNLAAFQQLTLNEQIRLQDEEQDRIALENSRRVYALLSVILVAIIIMLLIYRNNRQKQKANQLLQSQKEEINLQKHKVEAALFDLKSAQAQLIQSEKMASLGELTAGIAHEIQNPLNFVNNFSEVSNELIDEMKDELNKGDVAEAKFIADDIKQNLEKINHHGKRADAIVKGMLQHSRTSTGEKEATNINKLADEYLRLSYQGMRAKDNTFYTEIVTSFDETIGNINLVSQDIGRVLLNLYNNAFYAVNERQKSPHPLKNAEEYKPTVSVTTKKMEGKIEISVRDNGSGIPEKIKEKIFQPFFTTKPTGSGTGLGLSLSYDIVKAHGGEIKVESVEGEGSDFLVTVPILSEAN
ncbi:MAG TPA: ATP-binding protein [Panacibacter sp.]|nr:ATP-binding protein [Panacibacter sp.]HNP46367.1 ATP-binding protein [Panacibacter sp.]